MVTFSAKIHKFAQNKDKTGWSYIEISSRIATQLNPGCKTSFRVKGQLDDYRIAQVSLLPMGDGKFILPINAAMRKGTGKKAGDTIKVQFAVDKKPLTLSSDFITCLKDDLQAYEFFNTLPRSHQNYFSQWIDSAKTDHTRAKRITMALLALAAGQRYSEMIRANKQTSSNTL